MNTHLASSVWKLAALTALAFTTFLALGDELRPPFEVTGRAQLSKERRIKKLDWPKEPVKIEKIQVKGKAIGLGTPFTEEDDWLSGLTIKVKNISDKPIVFLDIAINFPRPDSQEPEARDHILYGQYPLAPGETAPDGPAVAEPPIRPGETVELALSDYEGTRRFLNQSNYLASITALEIDISDVYFDQNTKWSGGQIFRRDPNNPHGWIGERGPGRASNVKPSWGGRAGGGAKRPGPKPAAAAEHGNRFKYRAKLDDARGAKAGRWAWDVLLAGQ